MRHNQSLHLTAIPLARLSADRRSIAAGELRRWAKINKKALRMSLENERNYLVGGYS